MCKYILTGLCLLVSLGCATYHDDLVRGQGYYDQNNLQGALALWRALEIDWDSLSYPEQSKYAYLRGMTDYRLGLRADARHWLAVSKALAQRHPGGLDPQALAQMDRVLTELNNAVYSSGPPPNAEVSGTELTPVAVVEVAASASAQPNLLPAGAPSQTSGGDIGPH
jgi:hypothetical protein